MAMNKTEQAMVAGLKRKLAMAKAFRFTEEVKPDVMPPLGVSSTFTIGWDFNSHANRVWRAWSESHAHGEGEYSKGRECRHLSGSRGSRPLYSTKRLALLAMRRELEERFATQLANLDALIAIEPQGGS